MTSNPSAESTRARLMHRWRSDRRRETFEALLNRYFLKPPPLATLLPELERFLMPPSRAVALGAPFTQRWPPGGPWSA